MYLDLNKRAILLTTSLLAILLRSSRVKYNCLISGTEVNILAVQSALIDAGRGRGSRS